jgi:HlyD family secretion protein
MRSPAALLITLLLAAAGAALWWTLSRPQPVAVRIAEVERGRVEEIVSNTRAGTVKACRRARLAPGIGGQIATAGGARGRSGRAGPVAAGALEPRPRRAGVQLAEREAEAGEASARAACLNAEQAEREAARQQKLKQRRMASEEAVDRAQTAAEAGRADCEAARANARVAAARVGVAQAELERTRLVAPFAGVVAEVSGELNEYVTPSPPGIPTPPAVDLIDDSCFYISAPIDEVDAARVRLGFEARVTLDAFGEREFLGVVRRIAPYVLDQEKQARTVEVEVVIAEPPPIRHCWRAIAPMSRSSPPRATTPCPSPPRLFSPASATSWTGCWCSARTGCSRSARSRSGWRTGNTPRSSAGWRR